MLAHAVTPILNVSDIAESFARFEKLGWTRGFRWGSPPTFGSVCSGECEIVRSRGAPGGRGRSSSPTTKGPGAAGDQGVWMSIWVGAVDAVHRHRLARGIEVSMPPTDAPWDVREMYVRHPDGHVVRISKGPEQAG